MTDRGPGDGHALALIAVGGFAGAVGRHGLAVGLTGTVPCGTLVANTLGAFLLGVVLYEKRLVEYLGPETRLLVGTGFCSSFTTYSTFAAETATLAPSLAGANVAGTYLLGFVAVFLGRALVRWAQ